MEAMTLNARAGAVQIVSGRATLCIEAGREAKIHLGIMCSPIMAGTTAGYR
jgi:hypothetical protein